MKKETAKARIKKAVEKALSNESQPVKDYIEEVIYLTYEGLELDRDSEPHTSTDNLNYAIEINLEDELSSLLEEARRETEGK